MRSFAAAIVLVVLSSAHVRGSSPPQAAPQSPPSQATPPVQPDLAAGKVVFEGHCAFCHGMDGGGGRGPSLRRSKLAHAAGEEALKSVIENGIQPDMPEAWYLSPEEILGRCRAGSQLRKVPPEALPGDPARGKAVYARSGCSSKVLDYKLGYSMTMAALAIEGKIIVGVSGGEAGIRGFIDAYDAKTGAQAWRFWTTPGPDWNGDVRPGDNLYTCSFVAVDAATGKLCWYFQFSPHDTHDWDATHAPMLFDAQVRDTKRKLIAVANRNAFYYVLDRATGEFIAGKPYAKQNLGFGATPRAARFPRRIPNLPKKELSSGPT